MTEKTIEWNLAFAHAEVIANVEKLLTGAGYAYTRTEADDETRFLVTLPKGSIHFVARPLLSHRSPFNPIAVLPRTLLTVTYSGLNSQEEGTLRYRLTLAFLRVGG
jgi:hypothetical protein